MKQIAAENRTMIVSSDSSGLETKKKCVANPGYNF